MGRFRTTGIFAALVICFIAYVYIFEYKKPDEEKTAKVEASKLFGVKEEDVVKIQLNWAAGETVLVRNEKNEWKLESPVQDDTDDSTVKALLKSISEEASEETVTDDPTVDLSIFGLKDPLGSVTITLKSGEVRKTVFGQADALGNKKYILIDKDKKIGLISGFIQTKFIKTPKDLRSKKVLRLNRNDIISMNLKFSMKKSEAVVLKNEAGQWTYSRNDWDIDVLEVERYLAQVENMMAQDFVSEDKTSESAKKNFSTSKSIATIEFKTKEFAEVISFHEIKGSDVFATSSRTKTVYKVPKAVFESIELASNDKFRNKKKPFEFNKESIEAIDIRSEQLNVQLKKEGQDWKTQTIIDGKSLDQEKVKQLIESLHNLTVERYLGSANKTEYKKSKGAITLKGPDNITVLELKMGSDVSEKERWVISSKAQEAVSVSKVSLASLPIQTLLKESQEKKTEAKQ